MSLPNVNLTVSNNNLGFTGANTDNVFALIGACSKLNPASGSELVYPISSLTGVQSTLGYGPLAELAAEILSVAGGTVICVPTHVTAGSISGSPFAPVGGGGSPNLAASGTPYDDLPVVVTVTTAGLGNAAQFTVSLDGGNTTSSPRFMSGTGAASSVTPAGSGSPAAGDVVVTPGAYPLAYVVKMILGGAVGTATFQWSNNGGSTYSGTLTTAASIQVDGTTGPTLAFGASSYTAADTYTFSQTSAIVINDTDNTTAEFTLTFGSGTYATTDSYSFTCAGCSTATGDVASAVTTLLASGQAFSGVVIDSHPASVANVATIAGALDTALETYATAKYSYCFGLVAGTQILASSTQGEPATYNGSFNADPPVDYERTMCGAGTVTMTSPLTLRTVLRSTTHDIAARLASQPVQVSPAQYSLGGLPGVDSMGWEGAGQTNDDSTNFDTYRLATNRLFEGVAGVYVSRGITLAASDSDFVSIQNRRVMDKSCKYARLGLLNYLESPLVVNGNGTINEIQARWIESYVNGVLTTNVVTPGNAISSTVTVDRTNNVQSTKNLNVTIDVQAYAYAETISATIGFQGVTTTSA